MAKKGLLDGGSKAISLDDLENAQSAEEINKSVTPQESAPVAPEPEPAPVEEPKVEEPKAEEPKAPEAEAPKEEPKAEEPEKQEDPIQKSGFDYEFLSNIVGKELNSEDQVKEAFNRPTMEAEYNEVKAERDDLAQTVELLTEQLDPSTYFANENSMKLEAFKKDNPKKDPAVAQAIFATEDLSKVGDLEAVKMGIKFKSPNIKSTDKELEAAIAAEFGEDPDTPFDEWSSTAKTRLAIRAGEERENFDAVKASVKLPERIDITELKSQKAKEAETQLKSLQDGWNKNAQEVLSSVKDIKVPIGEPKEGEEQEFISWELSKPPEAEVEELSRRYIDMGLDPNDDNIKASLKDALETHLLKKNLSSIMKMYKEDLVARQKKEHLEETHNPTPLADTERTDETPEDRDRRERTEYATSGLRGDFVSKPLFNTNK